MSGEKRILVTEATGKAGRLLIDRVLGDSRFDGYSIRALCHNRRLDLRERLEVVTGAIKQRAVVDQAMQAADRCRLRLPARRG